MKAILSIALFALCTADEPDRPEITCHTTPFQIRGSSTVYPIAVSWAETYADICEYDIPIEGEGSSTGARQVCANPKPDTTEEAVDIGNMSREWKVGDEVDEEFDHFRYKCLNDPFRMITQVPVAKDGLSVVVKNAGEVENCIQSEFMGGGLSLQQLRWIFDSRSETKLSKDDDFKMSTVLPSSDDKPGTHLWCEMSETEKPNACNSGDSVCPAEEITRAGPGIDSGTYSYFVEAVGIVDVRDFGTENFLDSEDDNVLVDFLHNEAYGIAWFGYSYMKQHYNGEHGFHVWPVPIKNNVGAWVEPTEQTVNDGTYTPFTRNIYMNVHDGALENVKGYFELGFSEYGAWLITNNTGYVPPIPCQLEMYMQRLFFSFEIAGSSTVYPAANIWAQKYIAYRGSGTITVRGGGSSSGARQVCANNDLSKDEYTVDIGDMSREWKDGDEATKEYFFYKCLKGDTSRTAVQFDVAIDGLSVVINYESTGIRNQFAKLKGMTLDQLRWMFSDYSISELEATGWDNAALQRGTDNGDADMYSWKELYKNFPEEEILLSGPGSDSGTYEYFVETVLSDHDNGEGIRYFGTEKFLDSEDDNVLVDFLHNQQYGVSWFGYSYLKAHYSDDHLHVWPIPIQNDKNKFISPTDESVGSGDYNPLARRIFMNVYDCKMDLVKPFIKFAMSDYGSYVLTNATGYVAVPLKERASNIMKLDGSDPRICKNSQTFTMRGGRTCESMPAKFCNRVWKARRVEFHCPVRCNTCDFANRGLDSPDFKVTRKAKTGPRRVGCDQIGQYLSCDRKQKPIQKFVSGVERKRAFVAYWCQETCSLVEDLTFGYDDKDSSSPYPKEDVLNSMIPMVDETFFD